MSLALLCLIANRLAVPLRSGAFKSQPELCGRDAERQAEHLRIEQRRQPHVLGGGAELGFAKGARRADRVGAGCARISELDCAQAPTQRGVGLGKGCSAAVQSSRPIDGRGAGRADEVFEHCWRVWIVEIDHITRSQRVASVVGSEPEPVVITNDVGSDAIAADVTRQYVQQMTHGGRLGKVKAVLGEVLRDGCAQAGFVAQKM